MQLSINFTLGMLCCQALFSTVLHADVEEFNVVKVRGFEQVSQTPSSESIGYAFDAYVDVLMDEATSVTINGAPFVEVDPGIWDFTNEFATKAELDAAFPSSTVFTINISGGTLGSLSETVTLPMPEAYPAPASLTPASFASIQEADPESDLLIEWFAPDASTTFVALAIYDTSTEDTIVDTEFDLAQTSYLIPASDLDPDRTYVIELFFANVNIGSGNPSPGFGEQAITLAGYVSVTTAEFTTGAGGPVEFDAGLIKAEQYRQFVNNTSPGVPELWGIEGFFDAGVDAMSFGEIIGGAYALPMLEYQSGSWDTDDPIAYFESKADLDANFPGNTVYSMEIGGGDLGMRSQSFILGGDAYPAPGYLTGTVFEELSIMDPNQDFPLSWSMPDGSVDFVLITIYDIDGGQAVLETILPSDMATSFVIPANTVQVGLEYELELTFANVDFSDADPFPGFGSDFTILSGYLTDTLISFTPGSSPGCLADLSGDGVLNFFDVSAFLLAYTQQLPDADFTGDGVLNFFDVSAFLLAYTKGC